MLSSQGNLSDQVPDDVRGTIEFVSADLMFLRHRQLFTPLALE
ncbi:hypothetical protein N8553_00430 [bacterium]|nr:hypothetical protein [Planctomicrobium sp.]MDA7503430.1 hypothetical protein [bacterium]